MYNHCKDRGAAGYDTEYGYGIPNAYASLLGISPGNDSCSGAAFIGQGATTFSTVNASTDGPSLSFCGGASNIYNDLWYLYTPYCDGTLNLDTCTNAPDVMFDTVLAVYTGTCGGLNQIACNDDTICGGGFRQSYLSISVSAGVHYLIRVGGYTP